MISPEDMPRFFRSTMDGYAVKEKDIFGAGENFSALFEIRGGGIRISSGNAGSRGGLIALKKGTCHMAGSHLLDTRTGRYNISYINRYLDKVRVSVFHLVLKALQIGGITHSRLCFDQPNLRIRIHTYGGVGEGRPVRGVPIPTGLVDFKEQKVQ